MNKFTSLAALSLSLFAHAHALAQDTSDSQALCEPGGYSVGFFNGVWNTWMQAALGRIALADVVATEIPDAANEGTQYGDEKVNYELYYNTGCGTVAPAAGEEKSDDEVLDFAESDQNRPIACLSDVFESMTMRLEQELANNGQQSEQATTLFWSYLTSPLATLGGTAGFSLASAAFGLTKAALFENSVRWLELKTLTRTVDSSPTLADKLVHKARLDAHLTQREKLILVAHSQGNLFMHDAYVYATSKVDAQSVMAIHIAPASLYLDGPYELADHDLIINGALAVGANVTGTTPNRCSTVSLPPYRPDSTFWSIASFLTSGSLCSGSPVGGARGAGSDLTGHLLIESYLDSAFQARAKIGQDLAAAFQSIQTPSGSGRNGYFTVTLIWDGTGDVDLHCFEPMGAHVYYENEVGAAGMLDVDNTVADGPEHYYGSCDRKALQVGTYHVGINNFSMATGRTATVQVASYEDGVLVTKMLDVGAERGEDGNDSPIPVVDITVSMDDAGVYDVQAQ